MAHAAVGNVLNDCDGSLVVYDRLFPTNLMTPTGRLRGGISFKELPTRGSYVVDIKSSPPSTTMDDFDFSFKSDFASVDYAGIERRILAHYYEGLTSSVPSKCEDLTMEKMMEALAEVSDVSPPQDINYFDFNFLSRYGAGYPLKD